MARETRRGSGIARGRCSSSDGQRGNDSCPLAGPREVARQVAQGLAVRKTDHGREGGDLRGRRAGQCAQALCLYDAKGRGGSGTRPCDHRHSNQIGLRGGGPLSQAESYFAGNRHAAGHRRGVGRRRCPGAAPRASVAGCHAPGRGGKSCGTHARAIRQRRGWQTGACLRPDGRDASNARCRA